MSLRSGHRERLYQYRLAERLVEAGLDVEVEKQVEVYVNDSLIGYMYLDLWIENTLVVECKAIDHDLTNQEIGQVITYLAATGGPVGLLFNFGRRTLEFKRILPPRNVQDWHQYLYRCIWTPRGHSLPSIESVDPTALRFSVISVDNPESVSVRLSGSKSVEGPSATAQEPVRFCPLVRLRKSAERNPSAYASAGVDIDAGNRAVALMRDCRQIHVRAGSAGGHRLVRRTVRCVGAESAE